MDKQLWPPVPPGVGVHSLCDVEIFQQGEQGKPVLKLTFGGGVIVVYVTANVAEMIGGAAKGARLRFEDFTGKE